MNILFYSPFDQRSRDTESLMLAFQKEGHHITSLSQSKGTYIHAYLNSVGIQASEYLVSESPRFLFFIRHIYFFIKFCRKHKIDVVYSHLEAPSFVASVAQFLVSARVYICRHHIDEAFLQGFDKSVAYRLTYLLARKIIVVSNRARRYMVTVEKIAPQKIIKINLAYNFSLYTQPDVSRIAEIRKRLSSEIVLLTVCRFTRYKRADLSIYVVKKLYEAGLPVTLILLGKGEEELALKALAEKENIAHRVYMPGHVSNVTDYLASADFLLHPSVLESSCVATKEAGIIDLPILVCKNVGDFDDYVVHGENGFTVDADNFIEEAANIIIANYKNKPYLQSVGKNLNTVVKKLFSVDTIVKEYTKLNEAGAR